LHQERVSINRAKHSESREVQMKREARWFWAFFVGVGMAVGSGFLQAQVLGASRNPGCIQDAQEDYKDCVATCREFMQVEKDLCRNVDHSCAETCREQYQGCVSPHLEALEACKAQCDQQRQQGVQGCREAHGGNQAQLDSCVDEVQVQAFVCRDQCREGTQIRAILIDCRRELRSCIQACPPSR
jgi:hypothetical protein